MCTEQMTHEEWTEAIRSVVAEIPEDWYFTADDGMQYLYPEYNDRAVIHLYAGLLRLGVQRGWIIYVSNN